MQIFGKFSTTLQFTRRLSCNFSSGRYTSLVPTNQPQDQIKSEFSRPRFYSTKSENDNLKCVSGPLMDSRLKLSSPLSLDRLKLDKVLSVTIVDFAPPCCCGAMKMFLIPLSETKNNYVIENTLASVYKSTRHNKKVENVKSVLRQFSEKYDNSLGREIETIAKNSDLTKNTGLVVSKEGETNMMEQFTGDINNAENISIKDPIMSFQIGQIYDFAQAALQGELRNIGFTNEIRNALMHYVRFGDRGFSRKMISSSSQNFVRSYSTKVSSPKLFNSHIVCVAEKNQSCVSSVNADLSHCASLDGTNNNDRNDLLALKQVFGTIADKSARNFQSSKHELRAKSDKCKEDPCKETKECPDPCKDELQKVDHNKKLNKAKAKKKKPMGCTQENKEKRDGDKPKKASSCSKIMTILSDIPRNDIRVARISMAAVNPKILNGSKLLLRQKSFISNSSIDKVLSKTGNVSCDVESNLQEDKRHYSSSSNSERWRQSSARGE
uniref:Uncharacterized protein n=1 Tax=Glossina brevipalpis TaxID=37001 RepID=A0A1A9WJG8_9MUSC